MSSPKTRMIGSSNINNKITPLEEQEQQQHNTNKRRTDEERKK